MSGAMVTMLDVAKHIIDESDDIIDSHDKDVDTCKKSCYLEIMASYLKNRIPDEQISSIAGGLVNIESYS